MYVYKQKEYCKGKLFKTWFCVFPITERKKIASSKILFIPIPIFLMK